MKRLGWIVVAILVAGWAGWPLERLHAGGQTNLTPAKLTGTLLHPPSPQVTLILNKARETKPLDTQGRFAFAPSLGAPAYAELELDPRKHETLAIFLLPGQPLSLRCDTSNAFTSATFTGKAEAENQLFARLQSSYGGIDYDQLFQLSPDRFLLSLRQHQEKLSLELTNSTRVHPTMDARFQRWERARITYFGAQLRLMRLGVSGDWAEYASHLDLNDSTLLPVDTYSRSLELYTKAKAAERLAQDPALKRSINQVTEARYTVAVETYQDPVIRSAQLHEILRNQFVEGGDGPFGCKGIESLMARFDQDCADATLRSEIDQLYRKALAARNAPSIRSYKTVEAVSLDAHIFPAAGAKPGDKRPAYLFFHGGGWAAGMPEWGYSPCRRLAGQGLVGIALEYRLRWRHGTTPIESVADAKSAVRWARAHAAELGIDPDRIVVAGFSAGSHLAAATGMLSGYDETGEDISVSAVPNAIILSSAAVDVAGPGWFSECLAGRGNSESLSPAHQVRSGLPPMLVFHGRKDELGAFTNVEAFCQKMRAAGNRCELLPFPGGHFREPGDHAVIDQRTDDFLRSLGFLEPRPH